MSGCGEIIGIVTGVVGALTAIVSVAPHIRKTFEKCTNCFELYTESLNRNEDKDTIFLQEQKQTLQTIIKILKKRARQVDDLARLIELAEETVDMIELYRSVKAGHCFRFCCGLAGFRKRYLVAECVSRVKDRVSELKEKLRWEEIDIKKPGELERDFIYLVGGEVMGAIRRKLMWDESKSGRIGVYGTCGVGKTEVVRRACERMRTVKDSITFIWLELSYENDLLKLQMEIAKQIDLKRPINCSVQDNAEVLNKALRKKKNVLLVLDNMRKAISLEEIGLPVHDILIVITSRSFTVCCQMKCDDKIALKSLSNDQAYELLIQEIGNWRLSCTKEILFTLKQIAKECGGLPLAIVAAAKWVGKYFEYDDLLLTQRSLKMDSAAVSNLKYIEKKIIQDLELSYEQLKDSSYSCAKECLLHCIMYPRNHAFTAMELMMNWMEEGLLSEVEGTDEKLGEAKEILEELKDVSLLESIAYKNEEEIVKMHPIVWDIAAKSEKEKLRLFPKHGCRIKNFAWNDLSGNVERVSLMSNNLKELPLLSSAFKFHRLSTLLLQGNPLDIQLDHDFFSSFPNLKILNLSSTQVRLGPESLSCLKHLTSLLLRNCIHLTCLPSLSELLELMVLDISGCPIAKLPSLSKIVSLIVLNVSGCPMEELPSLSELKKLMFLDVSDCPMAELPHGMDHLTKLVHMNLSRTGVRLLSADHLVAKFKYLKQLLTIGCDYFWRQGLPVQDGSATWIEDVQKLEYLSVLEVTFPSLQLYNSYTTTGHWRQLSSFKFCVGGLYKGKLENNSLAFIKEFPDDENCFPENTSELLLIGFDSVAQLTIPNFLNLKFLDVSYCTSLKRCFPASVIDNLDNLEEIVIAHCENLEQLIDKDSSSMDFPYIFWWSLRKMTLFDLPQLLFIYDGNGKSWSMEEIGIWNCPQLQRFPILLHLDGEQNLIAPPSLKEIRGDESWLENLKRKSDPSVPFLEKNLIKEPPPEELTSRSKMVIATSDMASSSQGELGWK